jgi:hypothetical protein
MCQRQGPLRLALTLSGGADHAPLRGAISRNADGIAHLVAIARAAVAGPLEDAVAAAGRDDYATALRLFRPLADQGNALAQYALGVMYDNGQGVQQNYAEAAKWYRKAADQDEAHS